MPVFLIIAGLVGWQAVRGRQRRGMIQRAVAAGRPGPPSEPIQQRGTPAQEAIEAAKRDAVNGEELRFQPFPEAPEFAFQTLPPGQQMHEGFGPVPMVPEYVSGTLPPGQQLHPRFEAFPARGRRRGMFGLRPEKKPITFMMPEEFGMVVPG